MVGAQATDCCKRSVCHFDYIKQAHPSQRRAVELHIFSYHTCSAVGRMCQWLQP